MNRVRWFVLVLLLGAASTSVLGREAEFYIEADLTGFGLLPGDATAQGLEGQIRGFQFHSQGGRTFDAGGLPNRDFALSPVTIVKPVDMSSPLFDQAVATNNSEFDSVVMTFYREAPNVGRVPYYRVTLRSAYAVDSRTWSPDPGTESGALQSVTFVYARKIISSFEPTGDQTEVQIDWPTPVR